MINVIQKSVIHLDTNRSVDIETALHVWLLKSELGEFDKIVIQKSE